MRLRTKKVFVVGVVGVPARYGGFETLVDQLLDKWDGRPGIAITVFCSGRSVSDKVRRYRGANLVYLPFPANGAWSILYDALGLLIAIGSRADSVLMLGVSGALFIPMARLFSYSKIVVNVDGNEAGRAKWGGFAKSFLKLSTSVARKFASNVIIDNRALVNDFVGSSEQKNISVITYGGNHALDPGRGLPQSSTLALVNEMHGYGLSIARIVPENNIHLILSAVTEMQVPFIFVGNWSATRYGRALRAKYQTSGQLKLLDPIYSKDDLYILRCSASFYIHGASVGGTNPSLVEMMFFPVPIFIYDCSYNRETTSNAGYFYNDSAELMGLMSAQASGHIRGDNALVDIARLRYDWSIIGEQYFNLLT